MAYQLSTLTQDKRPCACGCGELIDSYQVDKRCPTGKRTPRRFKHGHNGSGRLHYDYKGGKYINDAGYVMVLRPKHPRASSNGYVREHILVMEAYLGRPIQPAENVHHINHNRADNRIENLKLFNSQSDHIAEHHGTTNFGPRVCYICGSTKSRWSIDKIKQAWICRNCNERKKKLIGTDGTVKHSHTYNK